MTVRIFTRKVEEEDSKYHTCPNCRVKIQVKYDDEGFEVEYPIQFYRCKTCRGDVSSVMHKEFTKKEQFQCAKEDLEMNWEEFNKKLGFEDDITRNLVKTRNIFTVKEME